MHNYDERKPFSSTCNEIDQSDKDVFPNNIYEVSLIENALHKIAALMQLGFGEAGSVY